VRLATNVLRTIAYNLLNWAGKWNTRQMDGPSCYVPQTNEIVLQSSLSKYPKLCRILILHELIHSRLYHENGDPDEAHGERFQAEIKRLWDSGAYAKVM
jgi:hypothetical protein